MNYDPYVVHIVKSLTKCTMNEKWSECSILLVTVLIPLHRFYKKFLLYKTIDIIWMWPQVF